MTSAEPRAGLTALALGLVLAAAACGGGGDDAVSRGEQLVSDVGCLACHSTGTDTRIGPGWAERWGEEVALEDGRTVVVDEEYLRRSVVEPDRDVVAGFPPSMPRVPLSDDEIDDVVAYLRHVSGGPA